MLLLGFGHKARNGKDTAAEAIRDYYHKQATDRKRHVPSWKGEIRTGIYKFADALYDEVNQQIKDGGSIWTTRQVYVADPDHTGCFMTFDLPDWVQPDPNPEKTSIAPYGKHPKLLQWWGTEFRRNNFGQDYWVKRTMSSIPKDIDIAMITDVRFPNEAQAVNDAGGYTVHVQRIMPDGTQYQDPNRPMNHVSETALNGWNWNFTLRIPDGYKALLQESAILYAEHLRELNRK